MTSSIGTLKISSLALRSILYFESIVKYLLTMKIDSFLVSIVGILGIVGICCLAVAFGLDGTVFYTGIGAISGIAGYNIRKSTNGKA